MSNERAAFQKEVAEVQEWWKVNWITISSVHPLIRPQSPRFERVTRPYTAEQVVAKRGTIPISYPSNLQAKKLYASLSEHFKNGTPSHTYGA